MGPCLHLEGLTPLFLLGQVVGFCSDKLSSLKRTKVPKKEEREEGEVAAASVAGVQGGRDAPASLLEGR